VIDPAGQQFMVRVVAGFQSGPAGESLSLAFVNPTGQTESILVKDATLAVFALISRADKTTFENGLDRIGDYHAVACAGDHFGGGFTNPIPSGFCAVSLNPVPGPDAPTAGGGQVVLIGGGATATYRASIPASFLPLSHIQSVLVAFSPYHQSGVTGVPAPVSQPAPAPTTRIPAGRSSCRAGSARLPHAGVAFKGGDRIRRVVLVTGGPALQLQVTITFDGTITTGSNQSLYELAIPLRNSTRTVYEIGATFRRGEDPAASGGEPGRISLAVDARMTRDTLVLRTPLVDLARLGRHFSWSVVETVNQGPRQTKAFQVFCGPTAT
jgi:hypothetical protein